MTTDNFCFYLQNRQFQTKQEVDSTVILPPLVFPGTGLKSYDQFHVMAPSCEGTEVASNISSLLLKIPK